ncbi:MAG: diacylglycerol/lipid kinase family protein, partial [Candidatus Binatia bacterium]
MKPILFIGNPKAGRGAWGSVAGAIARAGLDADLLTTERPGHAVGLARDARRTGAEMVVAVGGDGTVNEVVNGLLADGPGNDVPVLGVVPAGSGCDYAKTFDIPSDVEAAVRLLASDAPVRMVDAGEISFAGQRRYFANIAEVGV